MADEITPTQQPMGNKSAGFLVVYLVVAALASIYVAYSLWAADQTPAVGRVPAPSCAAGPVPRLTNIFPNRVSIGSASDVLLIGCGFPPSTVVKFNGTQHQALFVDGNNIRVGLTAADIAAAGLIVVTLSNDGVDFGSGSLTVAPAVVYWHVAWRGARAITLEVQILLMVLFTGAFGSCIYALKSLADYRGDGKLYATWFTYYLIQPLEGGGIAYLLYLVIRGGFLAGAGGDGKSVNTFGMCAIAGLAGAFSDTAFLKMREVFQTLFKPQDDRSGKLSPRIITATLADGVVGAPYKETLQASGGTAPLRWTVTPSLPAGLTLDATTGCVSGTPTAALARSTFCFAVTDNAKPPATVTADLTLHIKPAGSGLAIATSALPGGAVNAAYPATTLQATGGTAPLRWTVTPALPAALSLDPGTGVVSGTPAAAQAATTYTFTVTDSAAPPASASADLTLQIT